MEKLSYPLEGVPEAPDLHVLDNEQMNEKAEVELEPVADEPTIIEEASEAEPNPVMQYIQYDFLDWDVEW
jgi:hypothetical protein